MGRSGLVGAVVALALATSAALPASARPSGDPRRSEQWGLDQVRAEGAWALTQGRGAVVAVLDTGVDTGHPDLRGRLVRGATFVDCGDRPCGDGDWRSGPKRGGSFGHGTSVAGLVVAGRGNGHGIVGVAPQAKVMPVKIGDAVGISYPDIARGVRWAVTHGADVLNLSLALAPDPEVDAAIAFAVERGVNVVASAGNGSLPWCAKPADLAAAVCVTATDERELPAGYTAAGLKEGLRSVAAPGGAGPPRGVPLADCAGRVLSLWPRGDSGNGACPGEGGYRALYGTSLSAPHVAGVLALLRAQGRTAEGAVDALLATARHPVAGAGLLSPHYGHGVVDAAAAVRHPR